MRTVLLVFLLSGCAITGTNWNEKTPAEVAAAVQVDYDPRFDEWPTFTGPLSSNGNGAVLLRGFGNGGPEDMAHQVYLTASAGDWRFINQLKVEDGETHAFTRINSDVGWCSAYGCRNTETVGALVSWDYLKTRINRGFSVRGGARQGSDVVVFLAPNYIQGYLQAIRGYEGDVESASDDGSSNGNG